MTTTNWIDLCSLDDLVADSGVCALVGEEQVALFYLPADNKVYAVGQYDPIGKANVMSRGLIGSSGDDIYVASPLYKQRFRLTDGTCLDDDTVSLPSWATEIAGNRVRIQTA